MPVFWPGEFHEVAKSQTGLNDFHFHFFHRLKKMSSHMVIIQDQTPWKSPFPAVASPLLL